MIGLSRLLLSSDVAKPVLSCIGTGIACNNIVLTIYDYVHGQISEFNSANLELVESERPMPSACLVRLFNTLETNGVSCARADILYTSLNMAKYTYKTRLISQDSATLVLTGLSLQDDVIEPFPLAMCCQTLSWVEADTDVDFGGHVGVDARGPSRPPQASPSLRSPSDLSTMISEAEADPGRSFEVDRQWLCRATDRDKNATLWNLIVCSRTMASLKRRSIITSTGRTRLHPAEKLELQVTTYIRLQQFELLGFNPFSCLH
jgi:hypothetical protein